MSFVTSVLAVIVGMWLYKILGVVRVSVEEQLKAQNKKTYRRNDRGRW